MARQRRDLTFAPRKALDRPKRPLTSMVNARVPTELLQRARELGVNLSDGIRRGIAMEIARAEERKGKGR